MTFRAFMGATALASLVASPATALDLEHFESLVDKTIAIIDGDDIDVDQLYKYQDELIQLGVEGVKGYGAAHADFSTAMSIVAISAEEMKALNLVDIETDWHEGGVLEEAGVDTDTLYEDDVATTYMEAVIHPATAFIAVRAYEVTGDEEYLEQVRFELEEIVDHFDDIK